jgi:SAM-dependent methyltransferase
MRTEAAPIFQRLIEQRIMDPHHRVLCYGCGPGADVGWLKVRKFKVVGYDTHPSFGYCTPPEGKFDFVCLIYLMQRLKTDETRRQIIARAFEYVRPGGSLIISSRRWQRPAAEAGHFHHRPYFEYLCQLASAECIEFPEYDLDDASVCVIARKGGIYTPRNPLIWVESQEQMASICAQLRREPRIGLDVETTLEEPRVLCTVQLSTPRENYIIDALAMRDMTPLKELMEDEAVLKIIHNASFEEQMMGMHKIKIRNIYDTLVVSRRRPMKGVDGGHKLGEVCERELEYYLDKGLQTSDWTRRPLSPEQLAYAAIDAEVLLDLHTVFCPPPEPENLDLFA